MVLKEDSAVAAMVVTVRWLLAVTKEEEEEDEAALYTRPLLPLWKPGTPATTKANQEA